MSLVNQVIDWLFHFDKWLVPLAAENDQMVYAVLFTIIFCETGLIVAPFLPGDSLLFAAGALAAAGSLDIWTLGILLLIAAICGDGVNYSAGRWLADRVLSRKKIPLVNQKHLDETQEFYRAYGASVVVAGRFAPILRTFAPFVAGVAKMHPAKFTACNVTGAFAWICVCLGAGYAWGDLPFVKENFSLVLLGVVIVSLIPPAVSYLWTRKRLAKQQRDLAA